MNSFIKISLSILLLIGICKGRSLQGTCSNAKSPIDIPAYSINDRIKYPANPTVGFNATLYQPISNKKFAKVSGDGSQYAIDASFLGQFYMRVYNYSIAYNAKKIYLKMYAEHTIEGTKADLEMQIINEIDAGNNYKLIKILETDPSLKYEDYRYAGISIRFSAGRNKKSKDEFIEQLTNCHGYNCAFANIEFVDINQYFRKDFSYYNYLGTGTTAEYCDKKIQWFILNEVQDMSKEEYENLQYAFSEMASGNDIGNAYSVVTDNTNPIIYGYNKADD